MRRASLNLLRIWALPLLVVAVAGVVAWLGARYSVSYEVPAAGELKLSAATERLLDRLEGDIEITVFLPDDAALVPHVRRLLDTYREARAGIDYSIVDPSQRPERARELGVTRPGAVVVAVGDRREQAKAPTQARISAAMERLLRGESPIIAFLQGHGERDLLGIANYDMGQLGRQLQRKGYRLNGLRADADTPVPDNVSLLVVADPQRPLGAGARSALRAYLDRGGALLWLEEPEGPKADLAEPLGLAWQAKTLADPRAPELLAVDDATLLTLHAAGEHPVLQGLEAPLLLPGSGSLSTRAAGQWRAVGLLTTPERVRPAGGGDAGARAVAVAMHRSAGAAGGTREQRVLVVADSDFLTNTYLGNGANLPFALNAIDWLTATDSLLDTFQPAAPDQRLTMSSATERLIGLGGLLGLPLIFAGVGVWCWRRRRMG